jgi:hypothetical protein
MFYENYLKHIFFGFCFFLVENDRKLPFYYKFRVIELDSP